MFPILGKVSPTTLNTPGLVLEAKPNRAWLVHGWEYTRGLHPSPRRLRTLLPARVGKIGVDAPRIWFVHNQVRTFPCPPPLYCRLRYSLLLYLYPKEARIQSLQWGGSFKVTAVLTPSPNSTRITLKRSDLVFCRTDGSEGEKGADRWEREVAAWAKTRWN